MRALKGIRKGDDKKLRDNLLISATWLIATANRLHIDIEDQVWRRFPGVCSYCSKAPCECAKTHPAKRATITARQSNRPVTLTDFQDMFRTIYPPERRTLAEAGVHLAEETGEVSEAIHNYLGQHLPGQFEEIEAEIADYITCLFDVANSASFDLANGLQEEFKNGCHACHQTPCVCTFAEVVAYQS